MGRRRATPGAGEVNPLQRMLGTFFRLERGRLGYSTKEVAGELGLTDTYYRLAEAGRAALNQSLIFRIIQVFAASTAPTHESRTISFERLSMFLVGSHWVGAEMASKQTKAAGRRAMEELASLVSDFQVFHERTKRYFDFRGPSDDEQRRFLEEVAAPEVAEFLRSETYGITSNPDRDTLRVGDLPTLNIDILMDLKHSLTGRSFVHTADVAAKWESDRRGQFRYHHGLFASSDPVVSEANLDNFHYEFLNEPRFEESQIVFVNSEGEDATRRKFIDLLNNGRDKANLSKLTTEERKKIKIVCLTEDDRKELGEEITELLSRGSDIHEAYWGFETHSGLQISFIGLHNGNAENIRNLTLIEAERKIALFDNLWKSVHASR